jgi:hypothetical protein
MKSFKEFYRNIYCTFGFPLTARAGVPSAVLGAAEKRMRIKLPAALRDFYLVAGKERRFNTSLNRVLSPNDWFVNQHRLAFMEENQAVVYWGVLIGNRSALDPACFQGINDEPITWRLDCRRLSVWIAVMLHYQAVMGGYRFCCRADAPETSDYRFEKHGWNSYGEVSTVNAYSRTNQVVCLTPPGPLRFQTRWSIWAGAKTKKELQAIGDEIGISLH